MIGSESALVISAAVVVLGSPIIALLSMRRSGRGWARARLISYSMTAITYAINSIVIFSSGSPAGGGTSAIIALIAGRGARAAWGAWQAGDFRAAHLRDQDTRHAPSTTV